VHSGDVHAATTLRATNHALGALCGDVHECFTPYVLCATMLWAHSGDVHVATTLCATSNASGVLRWDCIAL
jgi:hypothetical protein